MSKALQARAFFVIPLLSASLALAADWPQWLGSQRNGCSPETGLLKEWPAAGPALLWRMSGLGPGYSSFTISKGRLFTMGGRDEGEYVIALDPATQKELWSVRVGALFKGVHGDGPRSTPTVDGDLVFALGTADGNLVCLKAATGQELWRKSIPQEFAAPQVRNWGLSESPLVDGQQVICSPGVKDAIVVALDRTTGRVLWKATMPQPFDEKRIGATYASPVLTEVGGIRQYVVFNWGGVMGVAAKDGRVLWRYDKLIDNRMICATPVVRDEYVFATSGHDGSAVLKLTANGEQVTAQEVYRLDAKTFGNHYGGVVLLGDYLYGGHGVNNGSPVCVEFKTGRIMWRQDEHPGKGSAAVVAADGNLYFRYENGVVTVLEATPAGYHLRCAFAPGNPTKRAWAYPVISDGRLFLREGETLSCYDIRGKSN